MIRRVGYKTLETNRHVDEKCILVKKKKRNLCVINCLQLGIVEIGGEMG